MRVGLNIILRLLAVRLWEITQLWELLLTDQTRLCVSWTLCDIQLFKADTLGYLNHFRRVICLFRHIKLSIINIAVTSNSKIEEKYCIKREQQTVKNRSLEYSNQKKYKEVFCCIRARPEAQNLFFWLTAAETQLSLALLKRMKGLRLPDN